MNFQPNQTEFSTDTSGKPDFPKNNEHRSVASISKRAFDILLAGTALVFVSPLFLLLMVLVRFQDGGSAFFVQSRPGLGGRTFRCIKFRTMVIDAQARLDNLLATDPEARRDWERAAKLKNDPRITWVGQFLRKSSLDELPQLINIIRGEMSIVGPRPITMGEIDKYGLGLENYVTVRPGLTGLWQVSGRSGTSYDERIRLDKRYVREWSFSTDLVIVAKTVPAILMSKGAY